jgi:hypothetical protein
MDNLENVIMKTVINNSKQLVFFLVHIYGLTRRRTTTSSSLGMCYMSLLISQYTAAKTSKIKKTPTFKIKTLCTYITKNEKIY